MPRWWLWTFYATIVWGIGYMILYPAWPMINGATKGVLGYSSRAEVAEQIQAVNDKNAPLETRIEELALADIITDDLVGGTNGFAYNSGKATFFTFCAQCHGAGGAGSVGYPNLLDNNWLWGGSIDEIYATINQGIRDERNPNTHFSEMPVFSEFLERDDIKNVVQYVQSLSLDGYDADMAAAGKTVFLDNCAACHQDDATGDTFGGAPNLADAIWLYGGDTESLTETVKNSRFGMMPAWEGRLSEAQIRSVAVFVHAQGGGQ